MPDARPIIERLRKGEQPEDKELLEIGDMMRRFMGSVEYEYLQVTGQAEIKNLLSLGREADERAEHRLGFMEGMHFLLNLPQGAVTDAQQAEKRLKDAQEEPSEEEKGKREEEE